MDKKDLQRQESISKAYFSQIHIFSLLSSYIQQQKKKHPMIVKIGIDTHPRIKSTKAK